MQTSKKSRAVAFLLAFFFGSLGAHRLYVGKGGTALVYVLMSVTVILWWVSLFLSLCDCILILFGQFQDKEGNYIKKW